MADPQIAFELLDESNISPALDAELRTFLSGIFPEWGEIFKSRRAWHDAAPVFTALARERGKVVGHVGVVERTITTCWNWRYTVAGFQGVSVAPNRRCIGIARTLLETALAESTRRGYPFAVIFCKEPLVPFYSSLGWRLPEDSMIMWQDRALPIPMRSNCPMYRELADLPFPEGPIDVHNPLD